MKFHVALRIVNENTGTVIVSSHHCNLSENEMNEWIRKVNYIFSAEYVSNSNDKYSANVTITEYGTEKQIYSKKLSNRSATEKDIWLKNYWEVLNKFTS